MKFLIIVDDSKTIQKQITFFAKELFPEFNVRAYSSGEEALLDIPSIASEVAIAIFDYNMSGMNGIELTEKVNNILETKKIVLCTANIQEAIKNKSIERGLTFIEKPLTQEKFKDLVQQITTKTK